MSWLGNWPLPYNIITGYQLTNWTALFGWSYFFFSESGNLQNPAFRHLDALIFHHQLFGLFLFGVTMLYALASIPLPRICKRNRFRLRIVTSSVSIRLWVFFGVAISLSVGITISSFVYLGFVIGGTYETLRTIRLDL